MFGIILDSKTNKKADLKTKKNKTKTIRTFEF